MFGAKRRDRELTRIEEYVRGQLASGQTKFVVGVQLLEAGGGRSGANRLIDEVKARLTGAGLAVVDVSVADWEYTAHIGVEAPARSGFRPPEPQPTAPAVRSSAPPDGITTEDPYELHEWLLGGLRRWSSPQRAGESFGPGFGLEEALAVVRRAVTPPGVFQAVASECGDTIIAAMQGGQFSLDAYDAVLGIDGPGISRAGVKRRDEKRLIDAAEESKDVLVSMAQGPSHLRSWLSDEGLRQRAFAYHHVALGRATGGP